MRERNGDNGNSGRRNHNNNRNKDNNNSNNNNNNRDRREEQDVNVVSGGYGYGKDNRDDGFDGRYQSDRHGRGGMRWHYGRQIQDWNDWNGGYEEWDYEGGLDDDVARNGWRRFENVGRVRRGNPGYYSFNGNRGGGHWHGYRRDNQFSRDYGFQNSGGQDNFQRKVSNNGKRVSGNNQRQDNKSNGNNGNNSIGSGDRSNSGNNDGNNGNNSRYGGNGDNGNQGGSGYNGNNGNLRGDYSGQGGDGRDNGNNGNNDDNNHGGAAAPAIAQAQPMRPPGDNDDEFFHYQQQQQEQQQRGQRQSPLECIHRVLDMMDDQKVDTATGTGLIAAMMGSSQPSRRLSVMYNCIIY